jgi:hypothetical protein
MAHLFFFCGKRQRDAVGYPMPMTELFYYPVIAELQGIFAATLKMCRYDPGFPAIAAISQAP